MVEGIYKKLKETHGDYDANKIFTDYGQKIKYFN